jgi:hypothetical protein
MSTRETLLLGLGLVIAATLLSTFGVVLQALDARDASRALSLRLALLGRLIRRPRWALGTGLSLASNGPQALAYACAPFVAVQAALALGLLLLLFQGERILHERVGRVELLGVVAIIGGVVLVAMGAPQHGGAHRGPVALVGAVALLVPLALSPFAFRGTRLNSPTLTIVASGCGFAATDIALKFATDDFPSAYLAAGAWACVGVVTGVAATVTGMSAFQRTPATRAVPISTAVEIFLPILLAPILLHSGWNTGVLNGMPMLPGLILALIGSIVISRTAAVSELVAPASGSDRGSPASGRERHGVELPARADPELGIGPA